MKSWELILDCELSKCLCRHQHVPTPDGGSDPSASYSTSIRAHMDRSFDSGRFHNDIPPAIQLRTPSRRNHASRIVLFDNHRPLARTRQAGATDNRRLHPTGVLSKIRTSSWR